MSLRIGETGSKTSTLASLCLRRQFLPKSDGRRYCEKETWTGFSSPECRDLVLDLRRTAVMVRARIADRTIIQTDELNFSLLDLEGRG